MIRRSVTAIVLSMAGISVLIGINLYIAHIYRLSGGKTRSCFGLVELGFFFKYYFAVFGLMAIILSIQARLREEKKYWVIAAFMMSIAAFAATFVKLWKMMV